METKLQPELLIDSHHGIYIPQLFAKVYGIPDNFLNWEDVKEDIEFLQLDNSSEKDEYWDVWDNLESTARLINKEGNEYRQYLTLVK